jgi:hypothetical protein
VLAGGFVANHYISEAHGITPPINDIDVFMSTTDDEPLPTARFAPQRDTQMAINRQGYNHFCIGSDGRGYKLAGAERDGMLNKVYAISPYVDPEYEKELATNIIAGFDLNCCQAAIDIRTGKLTYTEDFIGFLRTGQLKCVSPYTPPHTIMRLAQKKDELRCHCDLEEEYLYLGTLLAQPDLKARTAWKFGHKTLEKYHKYRDTIELYFALAHASTMQPVHHGPLHEQFPRQMQLTNPTLFQLVPLFETPTDPSIKTCSSVEQYRRIFNLIWRKIPKAARTKAHSVIPHRYPSMFMLAYPDTYIACDFHDKHLRKIDKCITDHPQLIYLFSKYPSVKQQLALVRTLARAARKHGSYVYGIMENHNPAEYPQEMTLQSVEAVLDLYHQHMTEQLTERIDISAFQKDGTTITELTTRKDLFEEGDSMHHCVGGYGSAVTGGDRIFHISRAGSGEGDNAGTEDSTLQLAPARHFRQYFSESDSRYTIVQHRGKSNGEPSKQQNLIATDLVNHLNKKNKATNTEEPDAVLHP